MPEPLPRQVICGANFGDEAWRDLVSIPFHSNFENLLECKCGRRFSNYRDFVNHAHNDGGPVAHLVKQELRSLAKHESD